MDSKGYLGSIHRHLTLKKRLKNKEDIEGCSSRSKLDEKIKEVTNRIKYPKHIGEVSTQFGIGN